MLELSILSNLIHNKEYWDRVLPSIKEAYFESPSAVEIFKIIKWFNDEYDSQAKFDVLKIKCHELKVHENLHRQLMTDLDEIKAVPEPLEMQFLIDETGRWMRDRACYNVIFNSISIYEDPSRRNELASIPDQLQDALSVSLEEDLGLEYWENFSEHWDYKNVAGMKIPFVNNTLNQITNSGAELKSLNAVSAGINVGKTTALISLAREYLSQGYDVIYFSGEIAAEKIADRFDPSILQKEFDFFRHLNKVEYISKMTQIKASKNWGRLFIKELQLGNMLEADAYIKSIKRKKGVTPSVMMFDYITEFTSYRLPISLIKQTDLYFGSVAREMRALMFKWNACGWTATQLQRGSQATIEAGLDNTADSITIPKVLDFQMILSVPEEMVPLKLVAGCVVKSRYGSKPSFIMKLCQETQTLTDSPSGVNILQGGVQELKTLSANMRSGDEEEDKAPKQPLQRLTNRETPKNFSEIKV